MDLGIEGRHALVTGSHRGTGAVIAKQLAAEGVHVLVHGPGEGDGQRALVEALREAGLSADAVWGDIRQDAGADALAQQVEALGVGIDILINNYGAAAAGDWQSATPQDWVDVYQQNVLSAVRMIQRFVPGMRERGWGRVVQLATIGVIRPNRRMPHYYASKGALANLTASLTKELAGSGVTVNTVSPGLIHTAEVEASFTAAAERKGWGTHWDEIEPNAVASVMPNPLGRMARREEVADLVVFLASERAAYLNGTHIRIDGGATETVF